MKADVAERLIALNRQFYTDFGEPFSATRGRLQPGVRQVLDTLEGDEAILDLGCGNGELARALARNGHRGAYLGLDFSPPLLSETESMPEGFPATFLQADLTSRREIAALPPVARNDTFDVICSFATLHHIPSREIRLNFLGTAHDLLTPGGRFIHSNWQFLNSLRLRERVQPWEAVGLAEFDVDPGDYLLDWRAGGRGLRYVHHFNEEELAELARYSGFRVVETFYSDGKEGDLAVYQEWKPG